MRAFITSFFVEVFHEIIQKFKNYGCHHDVKYD